MFFLAAKLGWAIVAPFHLLVLMGFVGVLLASLRKSRRIGTCLLVAGNLAIVLGGVLPVGDWLVRPLEERFQPWRPVQSPTGLIVLSGAMNPLRTLYRGQPVLGDAAERITSAATLARQFPSAKIVYVGRNGTLTMGPESELGRDLLVALGVDRERILLETRSRNTAENASFAKELIQPSAGQVWLLITSAFHMPRAMAAFRKVGFQVQPYPVDWKTGPSKFTVSADIIGNWKLIDLAAKEWIGLGIYWLTGRIDEIWPSA